MDNASTSQTAYVYDTISDYLKEKNLKATTSSWGIIRNLVVYSNGEYTPNIFHIGSPGMNFNENTKETIPTMESLGLLDKNNIFLVMLFPETPDCSNYPQSQPFDVGHKCAELYFIDSAATRNNKTLEIINFNLPDGTDYIRAYRIVN
ncbi:hypothetical protein J4216_06925 [Candidatus Woesearchaeota archaeon]|nr:hypothetical protein [Candidatus Woesearchaeota archaeon]